MSEHTFSGMVHAVESAVSGSTTFDLGAAFAAEAWLHHCAYAEFDDGFQERLRNFINAEIEAGQLAEDHKVAALYLNSGDFDDAGQATFKLYFRIARKGFGMERAIRIAEIAAAQAEADGRVQAIEALRQAVAALQDDDNGGEAMAAANARQSEFKAGVRSFLEHVAPPDANIVC